MQRTETALSCQSWNRTNNTKATVYPAFFNPQLTDESWLLSLMSCWQRYDYLCALWQPSLTQVLIKIRSRSPGKLFDKSYLSLLRVVLDLINYSQKKMWIVLLSEQEICTVQWRNLMSKTFKGRIDCVQI